MIILDTNIVSEPIKERPDPKVRAWIDAQSQNSLFICAPVLAELCFGVERLPPGARKNRFHAYIERLENDLYLGRVLPFDTAAAARYGSVAAVREQLGRRVRQMDALIAAIALTHQAVLATRDVDDFTGLGLDIVNPFDLA